MNAILTPSQIEILGLLRSEGQLSRWELHERTGLRPNTIGDHVAVMIEKGLIHECHTQIKGRGRPRVPLAIDPMSRHVVGVAIRPGHVEACRVNLSGHVLGALETQVIHQPSKIIGVAREMIQKRMNDQTFAVGFSVPGMVDPDGERIALSSALPTESAPSLSAIRRLVNPKPLIVDNDMHAMAARWMQTFHQLASEDVLIVAFDDGRLGAAMLTAGRPNQGCMVGGNELGHMRFYVDTQVCYCGHQGCLERIFSTSYLRRLDPKSAILREQVMQFKGQDEPLASVIDIMALGFSNAINFMRPNRLVLVSELTRYPVFLDVLIRKIRSKILDAMVSKVRIESWDQPIVQSAETAGWLALASIYHPKWSHRVSLEFGDSA